LCPTRSRRPNNRPSARGRTGGRPGQAPDGRRRSPGRARGARFGRADGSRLRSAARLFRPRGLLDLFRLLRLVGLLQLVWLCGVRLGRHLRMMALEATDDLAEVLVGHQALRLHLLVDLAPAGVALLRGDLVEREWRRPSPRRLPLICALRCDRRSGDPLVAGRELVACAGARRLSPRAHRDAESYDYDEHESGNVDGIPHVDPLSRLTAAYAFGVPTADGADSSDRTMAWLNLKGT